MKRTIFLSLILISGRALAGEVVETHGNIRALGMGGIWMSVVNNHDAIFVNPAALSKIGGVDWEVATAGIGINGVNTYSDIQNVDASDPSTYTPLFGKQIWVRAAASTSLALPYFGLGLYSETNTTLELHNPAFPQFQTHFINDNGMILGGAIPMGPITAGLSVKQIMRWGGDQDLDLGTIAGGNLGNIADQFQNKGRAYGVDLALMTEVPGPFGPRFSAVWQDVGSTAFSRTAGSDAPPRIHDNLSLGMSTLVDLPGLDFTAGIEYRHATESEYQFGQKLHLGTEISLPLIDIRGGLSQGYAAYGVGFDLFFIRFDLAQYTEEMGAYPGQTPQERLQAGMTIELGFDADFKVTTKAGKRRKLKQRR